MLKELKSGTARTEDQFGNHNTGRVNGTDSLNLGCNMWVDKRKHGNGQYLALTRCEEYVRTTQNFKTANR